MDYKRQTTVLFTMFVLVGMMFLVPAITEKAQAVIDAEARTSVCCFHNVVWHLDAGRWDLCGPRHILCTPHILNGGTSIVWSTTGIFFGDEKGFVRADVGERGAAIFRFDNPRSGANTCQAATTDPSLLIAKCAITQGPFAKAQYVVSLHLPSIPGHGIHSPPPDIADEGDDGPD